MVPMPAIVWDPNGPPQPFDWRWVLVTFMMHVESDEEGLFTNTIHRLRPSYDLKDGEVEDLRTVETIVRNLWVRYGPKKPSHARLADRAIDADNAAVDAYIQQKDQSGPPFSA